MDFLAVYLVLVLIPIISVSIYLFIRWIGTKKSHPQLLFFSKGTSLLSNNVLYLFSINQLYIFFADQAVIAELRNQIATLKSQWRDQIEQLNRERESC